MDSSPAVKILAVATLIYHNAMPNGPVLVHIAFHVLENGLPTLPFPPPRRGASSTLYAPLRPEHDATKVQQETALNVAPASRPSRRVLAGRGKQLLGKDASAARPRKRVRCVTKGTRDPSSPAGGGHLQTIGSTEVWNSHISTDRREAKFAPSLRRE